MIMKICIQWIGIQFKRNIIIKVSTWGSTWGVATEVIKFFALSYIGLAY